MLPVRNILKQTTSLCPECRRQIPGEVCEDGGRVFLDKHCPEHGGFRALLSSDRRFYYDSVGADNACQCGPGHSDAIVEHAATCIALIELVESCNLTCPTCYANSPFTRPEEIVALSAEEFWRRIDAVIARKGPLDILQLSGGEPTIHPRFPELLEQVLQRADIGYTLVNTNGVRIARDDAFAEGLGRLHRRYRKFELYLQFDGPQEAGQADLRGADLRGIRREVLARAERLGLPTTLAMTVTDENVDQLGATLRYGLAHSAVRGITLQPMFGSGRTHWVPLTGAGVARTAPQRRYNVADMVLGLVAQSDGLLCERDFTPLPCGDPNCHTIGYLLRRGEAVEPVSKYVDFGSVQGFLKDRVNFDLEDLSRCGCESEPLGAMLKQLEVGPDDVFRIFIKPFMDAWSYDQDRIDRCCVHVVGPGGRLESFCRHYALQG